MRKISVLLLILFIFYGVSYSQDDVKWQTVKSTHFIIYYDKAPQDFLNLLSSRAEEYYDKIANDLGFRRYDFWLWDNRAKIYIYDNADDYQSATGQPSWSVGAAMSKEKIIYTFPNELGFFDTILPHELGHIIFREFVGFHNKAIPLWLDEGVASYQESGRRAVAKAIVREAIKNNLFMDLGQLNSFNPHSALNPAEVNIFYAESLSIIDYLVKEFGSERFVLFCQILRDKKDLQGALTGAYSFKDIQDFNRAWQEYFKK